MLSKAEEALVERQMVDNIFKETGLVPESIEKKTDENGNVIAWIPHFEKKDLRFTLTEKGRKYATKER